MPPGTTFSGSGGACSASSPAGDGGGSRCGRATSTVPISFSKRPRGRDLGGDARQRPRHFVGVWEREGDGVAEQPFCRLTVLAPRHRVDVALPSDVPVAELVPMVLELVGEPGDGRARPGRGGCRASWAARCPAAATLGELGVLDGELLRLGPATPVPAAPVFDDPVDAVAAGAAGADRGHRFEAAASCSRWRWPRPCCSARPGPSASAAVRRVLVRWAGGGRAAGQGDAGARRGQARDAARSGPSPSPCAAGRPRGRCAGVALAAAAGWAAVPGPPGPVPLLAAAVAAGIAAAAAPAAAAGGGARAGRGGRDRGRRRRGRDRGAARRHAGGGGHRRGGAGGRRRAPAAPRRDPARRPAPAGRARRRGRAHRRRPAATARRAGRARRPRPRLPRRAGRAQQRCSSRRGALVAAAAGGWAGPAFAGVTAAVLLLRARGYADTAPARTTLAVGLATAVGLAARSPARARRRAWSPARSCWSGRGRPSPRSTPPRAGCDPSSRPSLRRTVDLVEGVLVAAAVPLALGGDGPVPAGTRVVRQSQAPRLGQPVAAPEAMNVRRGHVAPAAAVAVAILLGGTAPLATPSAAAVAPAAVSPAVDGPPAAVVAARAVAAVSALPAGSPADGPTTVAALQPPPLRAAAPSGARPGQATGCGPPTGAPRRLRTPPRIRPIRPPRGCSSRRRTGWRRARARSSR